MNEKKIYRKEWRCFLTGETRKGERKGKRKRVKGCTIQYVQNSADICFAGFVFGKLSKTKGIDYHGLVVVVVVVVCLFVVAVIRSRRTRSCSSCHGSGASSKSSSSKVSSSPCINDTFP